MHSIHQYNEHESKAKEKMSRICDILVELGDEDAEPFKF